MHQPSDERRAFAPYVAIIAHSNAAIWRRRQRLTIQNHGGQQWVTPTDLASQHVQNMRNPRIHVGCQPMLLLCRGRPLPGLVTQRIFYRHRVAFARYLVHNAVRERLPFT